MSSWWMTEQKPIGLDATSPPVAALDASPSMARSPLLGEHDAEPLPLDEVLPADTPPLQRYEKITARVRRGALGRLRDAVAGAQAEGKRTTLEGAVSLGLIYAARQLERRWNGGRRWPARGHHLPPGRRPRRRRGVRTPRSDER